MPYNSTHIKRFIEEVNEEAEKAAQAIYDKYQEGLELRIKNQMVKGHTVYVGMGTCVIDTDKKSQKILTDRHDYAEDFRDVLTQTQYTDIRPGFSLGEISK